MNRKGVKGLVVSSPAWRGEPEAEPGLPPGIEANDATRDRIGVIRPGDALLFGASSDKPDIASLAISSTSMSDSGKCSAMNLAE
jgi:hypothetical protein